MKTGLLCTRPKLTIQRSLRQESESLDDPLIPFEAEEENIIEDEDLVEDGVNEVYNDSDEEEDEEEESVNGHDAILPSHYPTPPSSCSNTNTSNVSDQAMVDLIQLCNKYGTPINFFDETSPKRWI